MSHVGSYGKILSCVYSMFMFIIPEWNPGRLMPSDIITLSYDDDHCLKLRIVLICSMIGSSLDVLATFCDLTQHHMDILVQPGSTGRREQTSFLHQVCGQYNLVVCDRGFSLFQLSLHAGSANCHHTLIHRRLQT